MRRLSSNLASLETPACESATQTKVPGRLRRSQGDGLVGFAPMAFLMAIFVLTSIYTVRGAEPAEAAPFASPGSVVDFSRDIRPIFEKRCYECHGAQKQKNGLRLDRKSMALRGGDSGKPAFVAGKRTVGLLLQKITSPEPAAMK